MSSKKSSFIRKNLPEIFLIIFAFSFSFWLMTKTFGYDRQESSILVAAKAWSDFAAHLPLIRSFSWGSNFPPEYPLFPGEPIRYHFLFYALVGLLEKIGLPLDWALNLPSILGFWSLLLFIYFLTKLLFQKRSIAFLSVLFFLFNGSLSFLEFFQHHPLSLQTPKEIITNNIFPSFGPYDGKIVSAFWNLNIYTNQRHLAPAYFFVLVIVYWLIKTIKTKEKLKLKSLVLMIIVIGLMASFHKSALIMTGLILASFFLYFPQLRKNIFLILFFSSLLAIPQLAFQLQSGLPSLQFRPGYLIVYPLTVSKIISYWFLNLGLSFFLIPAGFLLANKTAKKVFLSVFPLFLIGNIFQFSPEIAANHKFFNLFLIIGNMFSALFIVRLYQKNNFGKLMAFLLIFLLTFSGLIDFFPIKNDALYALEDAPKNEDILWIKENTPPDAVFLNSSYLYHPASLAGRKIFLGWPYFSWSAGHDTNKRDQLMRKMLDPTDLQTLCYSLRGNKIDYLAIEGSDYNPDFEINYSFFEENFEKVYQNRQNKLSIFIVNPSCGKVF